MQTLAEYRDKYALYHSDPDLRAMRAAHAMVAIWDDHEVEDNWAAGQPGEATIDPRIPFPQRRRNGQRAFFEHQPLARDRRDPLRTYGRLRIGRTVELLALDERRFRSDQPCGDRAFAPCPPAERDDPARTMLGAAQKRWLKRALERSNASWKAIANQVMVMALDLPAGNPINPDQWDDYGAERRELLTHIRDREIRDVAFFTGDIHSFFAGEVTTEGRRGLLDDALRTGPATVASEFVCGSVTSRGIYDQLGVRDLQEPLGVIGDGLIAPAMNPHLRYANLKDRGYGLVEANREELRVRMRSPRSLADRRSSLWTLASFRVARGSARVELD